MIYIYAFFSLIVLNGVACQSEYYNSQVDVILNSLSRDLIQDGLSEVSIPNLSYNYFVFTADFQNGYIKNLSTIERSGNVNVKMLQNNQTMMLSFSAQFDLLEFFYPKIDMYVLFMSPINNFNISITMQNVEIDLGVLLTKDFHNCTYYINLMTSTVGSYESVIGNIGDSTLDNTVISWIIDKILGYYTEPVDAFLNKLLQPALNKALENVHGTDIQNTVCKWTPAPTTKPTPKPTPKH